MTAVILIAKDLFYGHLRYHISQQEPPERIGQWISPRLRLILLTVHGLVDVVILLPEARATSKYPSTVIPLRA